jgi:eukaryotic-like serine/threonine-protein kinase
MSRGALSLALLLGAVNAACTVVRAPHSAVAPAAAAKGPAPVWSARAGRRWTGPFVVRGDTLFGAGVNRKVYAVDLNRGSTLWSARLSGLIAGGVVVAGDTVYVATSRPQGAVYALARGTGKRFWRTRLAAVGAPLSLIGGTLVAETQEGLVVGLDPASGNVRWRRRLGAARIPALPVDSGAFIVATTDSLFRLGPGGKVLRRAPSPGVILSPWIRMGDGLVAGTTDSLVVSIRLSDLRTAWRVKLDAPVVGAPAASGDTVYAVSRRGTLYRITGDSTVVAQPIVALSWPVTAPVTLLDGAILLGGADGTIRALRPADGRELWRLRLLGPIELSPTPLADGMLAIGGNGDIHRYRQ